ncbi:piccolo [Brachionus plicatilis]|uniref:Piccolo n=1 Tax=Brachionus plicatilis TaxID=10195 RepID=A0A3M7SIX1_BRAPC|nr:piccolo [Brachionus plicatilis]
MSTLNFNNSSSICSSNTSIPAENAGDPDSNSAQNFSSKLENVTEWLNKSFDHSKSNPGPASKSPNHLLIQRQQRSNSIAHTRVISDEPFIEINLNKSFYQSKSSAEKEIDSNLKTRYSKSQTYMMDSVPDLKNLTSVRKCSLSPHNLIFDKKDQFEDLNLHKLKLEQGRNKKDETTGTILAEMGENLKNFHSNSPESSQKPIGNKYNFLNEDDQVGPLNIKYHQCKNTKSAAKNTRSNEGRGFRELSVKRKEAVSNRDLVITDPALLYSLVQKQSINSNCQIPTNNLDNGTYLNSDRASSHSPIFLEQFSPDNGLYGKQNEPTESNCDQMINLARFRSSSPYRKNSNTDSSESCNNQKQTDVRIRVNTNDFEKSKFDEMHGISNAEDSESVASINYSPKPSSNGVECKSLLSPEEINNSSENKANSNSFIKHSQIDNDTHLFGDLQIQLSHSEKDQQIIVKILQARNLIAKDANGYSDPFVKVYLLPGRE